MVNSALTIVPFWTGFLGNWSPLRASGAFARGRALPVPADVAGHLMTCGRGGTGRRAALRSLWPKGRGSSSLLDRTIVHGGQAGSAVGLSDRKPLLQRRRGI